MARTTPPALGDDEDLLLPEEVAEMLRVPLSTLTYWRYRRRKDGSKQGPAWIKIEAGRVRYYRGDVRAYLKKQASR